MMTLSVITLVIAVLAFVGVVAIYIIYIYEDNCCVDISIVNDLRKTNDKSQRRALDLQHENENLKRMLDDVGSQNIYYRERITTLEEETNRLTKRLDVYNKCYRVVVTETVAKFKDKFEEGVKYRVMTPVCLGPLGDVRSFQLGVKHAEQDGISLVNKIADEIEQEIDKGCSN